MNITIMPNDSPVESSPRLMISTRGTVVLMEKQQSADLFSGTVLYVGESQYKTGQYRNDWFRASFDVFTDKIIMEN